MCKWACEVDDSWKNFVLWGTCLRARTAENVFAKHAVWDGKVAHKSLGHCPESSLRDYRGLPPSRAHRHRVIASTDSGWSHSASRTDAETEDFHCGVRKRREVMYHRYVYTDIRGVISSRAGDMSHVTRMREIVMRNCFDWFAKEIRNFNRTNWTYLEYSSRNNFTGALLQELPNAISAS